MHPETMTICTVFGANPVVPASFDYARDVFPLPGWMNGISSVFDVVGDHSSPVVPAPRRPGVSPRAESLPGAAASPVDDQISERNEEQLDGRFLDWPSSENKPGDPCGLQSPLAMTMDAGAELCDTLGEGDTAADCRRAAEWLRRHVPDLEQFEAGSRP